MRALTCSALLLSVAACSASKDAARNADSSRPAGSGETTGLQPRPESMPTNKALCWIRAAMHSASPEPKLPHRSPEPTPGLKMFFWSGSGLQPGTVGSATGTELISGEK